MSTLYAADKVFALDEGQGWCAVIGTKNSPPTMVLGFLSEVEAWRWLLKDRMVRGWEMSRISGRVLPQPSCNLQ